jgi:hypothetical protein
MTRSSSTTTIETPAGDGFPRELLMQRQPNVWPILPRRSSRIRGSWMLIGRARCPPSLILLYGPTGVGKTTLRLRLAQQLITEAPPALEKETARVPVLAVEAILASMREFRSEGERVIDRLERLLPTGSEGWLPDPDWPVETLRLAPDIRAG